MGSKEGQVEQTPLQAEMLKQAQWQAQRYQQHELPAIKQYGAQIQAAHKAGSFERERAQGAVTADTAGAFGAAGQQADQVAAARGQYGSAAHKLGVVDMAADQATAAGGGAVRADQAAEDQYVNGLGRMISIGRGQQATAANGMQVAADISGREAADAAQRSLQNSIGTAGLIGQGLGTAAAMYGGGGAAPNTEDYRGTELPRSLRGGR